VIPRRTLNSGYDVHEVLEITPAHLTFSPEEEQSGQQALERLGVPMGAPYVCIAARDTSYLKTIYPKIDFRYHDYRNSDIHDYLAAAETMVTRGYYVIRMGKSVTEELDTDNPKIINYAGSGVRSDFLDLYIISKCRMFIGSTDGILGISVIFRRPVVMTNSIPIGDLWSWTGNFLCIPKKLWLEREDRFLAFHEIYDSGVQRFFHTEEYEELGIKVVENTPEEIAAVSVEMDERLKGDWETSKEDQELQERFWSAHKTAFPSVAINSRIGAEFLRQNRTLLK